MRVSNAVVAQGEPGPKGGWFWGVIYTLDNPISDGGSLDYVCVREVVNVLERPLSRRNRS
jgi:hypothetical protein